METLIQFLTKNLSFELLAIIIFGGIFLTKYTEGLTIFNRKMGDSYKVVIASIVVSVIFYYLEGCGKECWIKYFITYLFATSFYELIVKWVVNKIKKIQIN